MERSHLQHIQSVAREAEALREAYFASASEVIVRAAEAMAASLGGGGRLFLFGNGGSAADAQHIASEFVNRLARDRAPLAAQALTTDSSALTSIANDISWESVFARQLAGLARSGDVAVGISTSGNSPNVVAGLRQAEETGLVTVGLLGRDGGKARALCRHAVVVPHSSTQRIQELHIMTGHILVELIEHILLPEDP